jgi:hypothetical protein
MDIIGDLEVEAAEKKTFGQPVDTAIKKYYP